MRRMWMAQNKPKIGKKMLTIQIRKKCKRMVEIERWKKTTKQQKNDRHQPFGAAIIKPNRYRTEIDRLLNY